MPFTTIFCDEASRISNIRNKQYKALKQLNSQFRIAATGSPIQNSPVDIYGILDWVKPGSLGNYWRFMDAFVVKNSQRWIVGYKNLDKLAELIKPYMLRRLKSEVLDLPDMIISDVPFQLGVKERKLYDQIRAGLLLDIEKLEINKVENIISLDMAIVKFGKLSELVDSMELLGEGTDSAKLDVLRDLLVTLKSYKVIIFSRFARMCSIIEREVGALKIIGDMNAQDRASVIEKFNNTDGAILVGSKAINYGLNLHEAGVLINYDQPLSLAEHEQRLGRAHRLGQPKNVLVYNLLCEKTIDQAMAKRLAKKIDMSALLLSDIKELITE